MSAGREMPGGGQRAPLPDYAAGDTAVGLLDIWRILDGHKVVIFAFTLAVGALSAAAALLMTPVYRAEVLLAPVDDPDDSQRATASLGDFGNFAALAGLEMGRKDRRTESIATLRSRKFTEQFIADRQLERVLFADRWDEQRERWKADAADDIPTAWDAFERFDERVRRIREDRTTGLVTLSVEWRDPELAAQWANELAASVNATLRQRTVDAANKAIGFLREQLTQTSVVDLQQVLHRLIESEMKKAILANINKEYAFKVIDPAAIPEEPVRPRKPVMIAVGVATGLMLGIIVALLRNARRMAHTSVSDANLVDPAG